MMMVSTQSNLGDFMDITIQHEEEKATLRRKDYRIRVFSQSATPDRNKVTAALAKELKSKPELTIVQKISPVFGDAASIVDVRVYQDEAALKEFESAHITKRHAKSAEKAGAAKKAAEEAKAAAEAKAAEEAKAAKEAAAEEAAPAEEEKTEDAA